MSNSRICGTTKTGQVKMLLKKDTFLTPNPTPCYIMEQNISLVVKVLVPKNRPYCLELGKCFYLRRDYYNASPIMSLLRCSTSLHLEKVAVRACWWWWGCLLYQRQMELSWTAVLCLSYIGCCFNFSFLWGWAAKLNLTVCILGCQY